MIIKKTLLATAFTVASLTMMMAPMTVFAGGEDKECTCQTKCNEDEINNECEICNYDYTYCEGKEEENWGPLTPDGNMNLIDDYGSMEAGGKQFITLTTKSGSFFYIIIDRDDQGTETVHFLNLVDEADLLALMDDEQVEEYLAATQDKKEQDKTVVIEDEPVPGAIEDSTEISIDETEEEPVVKENNINIGIVLLPIIAVLVVAGVIIGKVIKSNNTKKDSSSDPDFDYEDDSMSDFLDEELPEDDVVDTEYDLEDNIQDDTEDDE